MGEGEGDEQRCVHCALPLPRRVANFCCSGCYLAHHLLGREVSTSSRGSEALLARLSIAAFLAIGVMVLSLSLYGIDAGVEGEGGRALQGLGRLGALALSVPIFLLLGLPLLDAVLAMRRWLSADSLVLAGAGSALLVSVWNTLVERGSVYYETATMVLVLFTLGRLLDTRARERARDELELLASERRPPARRVSGELETEVAVEELRIGDELRVRPGETIPVDGVVIEGRTQLDRSELTGEEQPARIGVGDTVLAAERVIDGSLLVRASAAAGDCVRDELERLLRESTLRRPRLVGIADRAAAVLIPVVVSLAIGVVLWQAPRIGLELALLRALSVVLIACPCALGLATPLAFWVALGAAWRAGALVRGAEVFETLARARRVFLDKTGTLTTGELELRGVQLAGARDEDEVLRLAAALERDSEHPIGRALRAAWRERGGKAPRVDEFRAIPGVGVEGCVDGRRLFLGRPESDSSTAPETRVVLEENGERLAELRLAGELRPEAPGVVDALRSRGLEPHVLTGDTRGAANALARVLEIPVESGLLPADKAQRLHDAGPRGTVFVGDGLNDALALASADVGISMRKASPRSLESASVNLLRGDLATIPALFDLARAAVWTARTNLMWAFVYNLCGLFLAVSGRLTPIFAAGAMALSSLFVVLNSGRLRSRLLRSDSDSERSDMPIGLEASLDAS